MPQAEERLMCWLREAHAMQRQAQVTLLDAAGLVADHAQIRGELQRHAAVTGRHVEALERCIERRSGQPVKARAASDRHDGYSGNNGTAGTADSTLHITMACYTVLHMAIASCRSLVAGADSLRDAETTRTCEAILKEQLAMAAWLEEQIPRVTVTCLQCGQVAGLPAGRRHATDGVGP